MDEALQSEEIPKFKDIRRYYCQYCGICRSKKTLITSHINTSHKDFTGVPAVVDLACMRDAMKMNVTRDLLQRPKSVEINLETFKMDNVKALLEVEDYGVVPLMSVKFSAPIPA